MVYVLLYILAGIVNVSAEYIGNDWCKYISKVMLMPLLMLLLYNETKDIKKFSWIYLALFFSWLGDIFLMFPRATYTASTAQLLFVFGLSSFLLAHVNYIIWFIKETASKPKDSILRQRPFWILPFLLYLILLLRILFPTLGVMKIPVTLYGICIILMLITAFNRKNLVHSFSYYLVFIGAVLFVLSDSLIAINIFYEKQEWHRSAIMITYILAQGMIVHGILDNRHRL